MVEVADSKGFRPPSNSIVNLGLESAITIAQQDRDRVGAGVRHNQVELAIAVEIVESH